MYRGLILGALALIAVFTAQRQFGGVGDDIKRYNRMRAMSGDPPMLQQALSMLATVLKSYGRPRPGEAIGVLKSLQYDILRYARIATM